MAYKGKKTVTVPVDEATKQELRKLAAKDNRSLANYAEKILKDHVKESEKDK